MITERILLQLSLMEDTVQFPDVENIGEACKFWSEQGRRCYFPNTYLLGAEFCMGAINIVCTAVLRPDSFQITDQRP